MKPQETVDYHIKLLWHSIANLYNQIAQEFNLTQTTGFVLLNIDSKKGTPATAIAPLMGMKATSLSRVLKNMENERLICRKKDSSDGRMVRVLLTKEGEEKKKIAKKVVRDFNNYLIDNMGKGELSNYFDAMTSLNRITEDYKKMKLK